MILLTPTTVPLVYSSSDCHLRRYKCSSGTITGIESTIFKLTHSPLNNDTENVASDVESHPKVDEKFDLVFLNHDNNHNNNNKMKDKIIRGILTFLRKSFIHILYIHTSQNWKLFCIQYDHEAVNTFLIFPNSM